MKFVHHVDRNAQRMVSKFRGKISYVDLKEHLHQRGQLPVREYPQLADFSEAELQMSTADVERMVQDLGKMSRLGPIGRTAILVQGELSYGIGRMISAFTDQFYATQVFRNRGEALEWLGWE